MKQKAFFINFKRPSTDRNCLKPDSESLIEREWVFTVEGVSSFQKAFIALKYFFSNSRMKINFLEFEIFWRNNSQFKF